MGLVGNLTKHKYIESDTETELLKIDYPNDLPVEHPDFDKAGTTKEIEVPKIIETLEIFNDIYLHIHSYNVWKVDYSDYDLVNICYRVFESKEARDNDQNSFLFEEHLEHQNIDYSLEIGQLEQCYLIVKNLLGYQELIND